MDPLSIFTIGLGSTVAVYGVVSTFRVDFHPGRLVLFAIGLSAVMWGYVADEPAGGPMAGLNGFMNDLGQFIALVGGAALGWKAAHHE